jgi:hypothetical protein
MTMITPEEEIAHGTEVLNALYESVRALRREIEELAKQAQLGENLNETDVAKPLRNVHGLVALCAKAESNLYECRSKQAGIAKGGYALDLDQARADIGCKLDRLRRCSGARPVSE